MQIKKIGNCKSFTIVWINKFCRIQNFIQYKTTTCSISFTHWIIFQYLWHISVTDSVSIWYSMEKSFLPVHWLFYRRILRFSFIGFHQIKNKRTKSMPIILCKYQKFVCSLFTNMTLVYILLIFLLYEIRLNFIWSTSLLCNQESYLSKGKWIQTYFSMFHW